MSADETDTDGETSVNPDNETGAIDYDGGLPKIEYLETEGKFL